MFSAFKNKNFIHPLLIWTVIVLWYVIFAAEVFTIPRLQTQDLFTQQAFYLFGRKPQDADKIVIVAIDEGSRQQLAAKWDRAVTARLIRNIASFSPRAIALDIIFAGKASEAEDSQLVEAIKTHPNIILGHTLGDDKDSKTELPYQDFIDAAKGVGYITHPIEDDKVIRNLRPFHTDENKNFYVSIELRIIAGYLKTDPGSIPMPQYKGITPINYLAHPNRFYTIPAYLVLEKKINPAIFKDKIVLVGATDPLMHDYHPTPIGIISGVSIIANSLVMILSGRYLTMLFLWQIFPIILLICLFIIFICSRLRFTFSSLISAIILFLAFTICLILRAKDFQVDYFSVFFLIISSFMISNIYKYSYLIYMSSKLKNLAIIDPLTGFYTFRYFLAKLDQDLGEKSKNISFVSITLANYRRLALEENFEELKSLLKLTAEFIKSAFKNKFKKISFCRISEDIMGITLEEKKKANIEEFLAAFLEKLGKVEFKIGEKILKITPKAVLIYTPKDRKTAGAEIVHAIENAAAKLRNSRQENITVINLDNPVLEMKKEIEDTGMLDFVAVDLQERNKDIEKKLKALIDSQKETETAYFEAIRSLIKALEEKDTYTQGHSERVAKYSLALARQLNLSPDECDDIYKAALLHDIGKIGIPDYTLHKKERLTDEEFELIKKHEIMSVEILKPIKPFNNLLPIILHHHEKFDGTGYPYGLSAEMIPRGAQILAVADAFDAITCGRGYKKGAPVDSAIAELEKNKGTQFNPAYVDALKQAISSGRIKF